MIEKQLKMYKEKLAPSKEDKSTVWQKVEKNIAKESKSSLIFGSKWQGLFTLLIIFLAFTSIGYLEVNRTNEVNEVTLTEESVREEIDKVELPKETAFEASDEGVDDWEYDYSFTSDRQSPTTTTPIPDKSFLENTQEQYNDFVDDYRSTSYLYIILLSGFLILNIVFTINFIFAVFRKYIKKKSNKLFQSKFIAILTVSSTLTMTVAASILLIKPESYFILLLLALPGAISFLSSLGYILNAIIKKLKKVKSINLWKRLGLGTLGLWQGALAPIFPLLLILSILGTSSFQSEDFGGGIADYSVVPAPKNALFGAGETESSMNRDMDEEIGFSTGGAKDINNFRENIKNGFLPLPTDITYEGLFYDYYFDTGETEKCEKLFCPSYSTAVSKDPINNEEEYFMTVGLNSGMKESDFERKKLNLVVVLDISGSMSSPFNQYYYDRYGNEHEIEDYDTSGKSKMEVANESVVALLDHLNDDDQFGMVLFDSDAYLAKRLRSVGETDMANIKDHILDISPRGSTNMEAGMKMGTKLYNDLLEADQSEYENRIIFLTDAMPNTGITGEHSLLDITESNSNSKLYSSFIGVGVDFNTELVESITKIKGSNYYSVHSSKQFKERMDEQFEYMVTPLVFDLNLTVEAEGFDIKKVYGSPEADEATGEIMKVNTLFPSKRVEGETKGGVVLLQLKKTSENNSLKLSANFEDREGNKDSDTKYVEFDESRGEYYENSGIRKSIALTRYVNMIKNWINDERLAVKDNDDVRNAVNEVDGIVIADESELGEWERQSMDLNVSGVYKELFEQFMKYFKEEIDTIGDDSLNQEISLLEILN